MTLESLARTIAKARYGTDDFWVQMMPAARAVVTVTADWLETAGAEPHLLADDLRALTSTGLCPGLLAD